MSPCCDRVSFRDIRGVTDCSLDVAASFMNTVILSSVLSAGNHAMFAGTRKIFISFPYTPPDKSVISLSLISRHPLCACNYHTAPCTPSIRYNNTKRCSTLRPTRVVQYQWLMLRELFYRQRRPMGMAAKSSWCFESGVQQSLFYYTQCHRFHLTKQPFAPHFLSLPFDNDNCTA